MLHAVELADALDTGAMVNGASPSGAVNVTFVAEAIELLFYFHT
jgi:hypothetical protein